MNRSFSVIILMIVGVVASVTAVIHAQNASPFTDVTEVAGLTLPDLAGRADLTGSQTWGDFDQDGWLDLYLTDTEGANVLYRNNGDGTFSISPLTASISLPDALSGGAVFADYDNDGWPDLYVMNWGQNVLFHNHGGDNFTDVSETAGVGDMVNGRTVAWTDLDKDGWLDLYLAGAGDTAVIFRNMGDGRFVNATDSLRIAAMNMAAAAPFADYDYDGQPEAALSAAVVNGSPTLFDLNGNGTVTHLGVGGAIGATVGAAYADYDQDGRVDLLVGNFGRGYRLYHNQASGNNWLTLKLIGGGSVNRDAVGTQVTVVDSDGRSQMQEVKSGSSLGAGNALELYFGLGQAEVTAVNVQWPDGTWQQLGPMTRNQRHEIAYGVNPITPIDVGARSSDLPAAEVENGGGWRLLQTILTWAVVIAAVVLAYNFYLYWQVRQQK